MLVMITGCDMLLGKVIDKVGQEAANGAATPSVSLDCETSFEKHYGEEAVLAVNASASDNGE